MKAEERENVEDLRVGGIVLLKWILNGIEGLRLGIVIYGKAAGKFFSKTVTKINLHKVRRNS